jgi:hypothetical protein
MRAQDDIWLPEDQWGVDLVWEDDHEDSKEGEDQETPPEDPRY